MDDSDNEQVSVLTASAVVGARLLLPTGFSPCASVTTLLINNLGILVYPTWKIKKGVFMKRELRLSALALFFIVIFTACGGNSDSTTTVVPAGKSPSSVAVDPSGKFAYTANWGSNNISVYTINATTGALTAGTAVAAGTNPNSVTVDPSGKFAYAANEGDNSIFVFIINPTTGAIQ